MQSKIEHHQKLINLFLTIYNDPHPFQNVTLPSPSEDQLDENEIQLDETTLSLLNQLRPFLPEEESLRYIASTLKNNPSRAKAIKEKRLANLADAIAGAHSHQLFIRLLNKAITDMMPLKRHELTSDEKLTICMDIATALFPQQLTGKQKEFLGECYSMLLSAFKVTGEYNMLEVAINSQKYTQKLLPNTIRVYIDTKNDQLHVAWIDDKSRDRIHKSLALNNEEDEELKKITQLTHKIQEKRKDEADWEKKLLSSIISTFNLNISPENYPNNLEIAGSSEEYNDNLPSDTIRVYRDTINARLHVAWTDNESKNRVDKPFDLGDESKEIVQMIHEIKKPFWEEQQLLYSIISRFNFPVSSLKRSLDKKAYDFLATNRIPPENVNASCLINTEFKLALQDLARVLHFAKETHDINPPPVLNSSLQVHFKYFQEELLDNVAKRNIDDTQYLLMMEAHAEEFEAAWRDFHTKFNQCTWRLDDNHTAPLKEVLESLMALNRKINKHISLHHPTDIANIPRLLWRFLCRILTKEDYELKWAHEHQHTISQLLDFLDKTTQGKIGLPGLNEAASQYVKMNVEYASALLKHILSNLPSPVSLNPQEQQKLASILKEAINPGLSMVDDSLQNINTSKEITKANKQKPLEELASAMKFEPERSIQAAFRYRIPKEKYQEISGPELHYLLKAVKDASGFPDSLFPCPEVKELVAKLDNKNKEAMNQKGIYSYDQFIQAVNSAIMHEKQKRVAREEKSWMPNFLASFIYRFHTDHLKLAKFQVEYLKARYEDRTKSEHFLKANTDSRDGASRKLMEKKLAKFNVSHGSEKLPFFREVFSKLVKDLSSLFPSNYALKKFHDLHTQRMQKMNAWKQNTTLFPVNEISATPLKEIEKMTEKAKEGMERNHIQKVHERNNEYIDKLTGQGCFIENPFLSEAYFEAGGNGKRSEKGFDPLKKVKMLLKQVKEIAAELDNIALQLNEMVLPSDVKQKVIQLNKNLVKVSELEIPKEWGDVYSKFDSLQRSISFSFLNEENTNSREALRKVVQDLQNKNHQLYTKLLGSFEKELDKVTPDLQAKYFRSKHLNAVRTFIEANKIKTKTNVSFIEANKILTNVPYFNRAEKDSLAQVGKFLDDMKRAKKEVKESCRDYTQFLQAQIDIEKQLQTILNKIREEANAELSTGISSLIESKKRALEGLLDTLPLDSTVAMSDDLKMISRYKIKQLINRLENIQPETITEAMKESETSQKSWEEVQSVELSHIKVLSQHVRTTMEATEYLAAHTTYKLKVAL
jgi:hypothetical protein